MNDGLDVATLPEGCVRDLDPASHEFRRVTFVSGGETSTGIKTDWSVLTEIVLPTGTALQDQSALDCPPSATSCRRADTSKVYTNLIVSLGCDIIKL